MRKISSILLLALLLPCHAWGENKNDSIDNRLEQTSRYMDIFSLVYKELDRLYVDTITPKSAIENAIEGLLADLDPYTVYISEEDEEEFQISITGEYAGVGASVGPVNGNLTFTEIYEGSPAFKSGIKAGDQIISINGKNIAKDKNGNISESLRGEANSQVKLVVRNPISLKERKVTITRETITLPTIEYCDILESNIGYIRFSGFKEKSAEHFKNAFLSLKAKGATSLIIDLRNNPGGLLDQATEIVNLFVDNQSVIVYTKSKVKQLDETYKASKKPLDKDIPIVVLVNKNSASASEIFSGVLQDLDRAVILGERTYGKGLVQMTRDLPFGGSLKITTSKYYIPSGRCVQAINYAERDEEGYVKRIPDSLTTEFKTANGRPVRDGGGVMPDVEVKVKNTSTISYYLYTKEIIFDYAVQYLYKHPKIAAPKDFKFTDYNDFKTYAKSREFSYQLKTEELLKDLKKVAEAEGYLGFAKDEFDALENKLSHNLEQDLDIFEEEITRLISIEIIKQQYLQKAAILEQLKMDEQKIEAIKILKDKERYNSILAPKK